MKYRLFGLCIGLFALSASVACGGSDSPPAETPGDAESPAATGAISPTPGQAPTGADSSAATDTPDPVAIVNDEEISKDDYERQLAQIEATYVQQGMPLPQGAELTQLRQQILQQLIQQTLVVQETRARDIPATDEEVDAQYQEALESFPDEETFNQTLESEGLTREDLEALIADNIKVEKLLNSVVEDAQVAPPTEEELRELYDLARQQQQDLPPFEEVREALVTELVNQRETEAIQAFVQELEAESNVEIRLKM